MERIKVLLVEPGEKPRLVEISRVSHWRWKASPMEDT